MFVFPEMPHFSHFQNQTGKIGHFWKYEQEKVWHFEKKHVINFKTGKTPKLGMFDFGAFQEKMHIPSPAKFILHILFGAFQETPRNK